MLKIFLSLGFVLLSGVLFVFAPDTKFPKALLVEGKPIHPMCVLNTQFGDSSRFEPHPVYRIPFRENDDFKLVSEEIDYSRMREGIVSSTINWKCKYRDPEYAESKVYVIYQAWEVFSDTCLIWLKHYDTDGTGVFSHLGLVKRTGDSLLNVEEIAFGDRCHGEVSVDFFKDGIVQFRSCSTPGDLFANVQAFYDLPITYHPELGVSPIHNGGYVVTQCKIKKDHAGEMREIGYWIEGHYSFFDDFPE